MSDPAPAGTPSGAGSDQAASRMAGMVVVRRTTASSRGPRRDHVPGFAHGPPRLWCMQQVGGCALGSTVQRKGKRRDAEFRGQEREHGVDGLSNDQEAPLRPVKPGDTQAQAQVGAGYRPLVLRLHVERPRLPRVRVEHIDLPAVAEHQRRKPTRPSGPYTERRALAGGEAARRQSSSQIALPRRDRG